MMNVPFPYPALAAHLWTIAWWLLLAMGTVPLVRIFLRREKRVWVDSLLACLGFVLAFVMPSLVHAFRNAILVHDSYAAADTRHNAMPLSIFFISSEVVILNAVWLSTAILWKLRLSKKLECALIYVVAGIVSQVNLGGCYYPIEAAHRSQCRNNLQHIGLAFHNYHDKFDRFPSLAERPAQPERSWRVDVLPYMDHAPLRNQYVDAAAWDSPQNLPLAKHRVPPLQCPAYPNSTRSDALQISGYAGIRGPNTAFPDGRGMSVREFTDGTSRTLLVVEACGRQIVWTEPRDIDLAEQRVGVNLPGEQAGRSRGVISGYHLGGGQAAFADGSVRFISENIDPAVLKALLTATGGETITGEY